MPLPRTVSWRRTDVEGAGLAHVTRTDAGVLTIAHEVLPGSAVHYQVTLDRDWVTREARIEVTTDRGARTIDISTDGSGAWRVDGQAAGELDGCIDIDVAATPLTNTFPVRRLGLDVGDEVEIEVAWVGVPELEIERVGQVYARLEPIERLARYSYRPVGSENPRLLTVDEDGLVVDYEGFAQRMA